MLKTMYMIVLAGLVQFAAAQTEAFELSWDANSESDIYQYKVFRSLNANANTELAKVAHPATDYRDRDIEKGVRYFYRLKAVDYSLNESGFSAELSVAIPRISDLPASVTTDGDTTIIITLDDHVDDPDDTDATLTWSIDGASVINATLVNRVATLIVPSAFSTTEAITFRVSDDDGFEDSHRIVYSSTMGGGSLPPVFTPISQQSFDEDNTSVVDLSEFVSDTDSNDDQLVYSVDAVDNLSFSIDDDQLTITPDANWSGERTTQITVTDESGNSDETELTITVNPVNDAPLLSALPQVTLAQNSSLDVDLSGYASDVDNEVSDLQWTFDNYDEVNLSWNAVSEVLAITSPADWQGFEYIIATVEDPLQASYSDTLVVRVTGSSFAPQISSMPDVTFNEDGSTQLNLSDYVSDGDDPMQNLFWRSRHGDSIHVHINHSISVATFTTEPNWNGNDDVWMIVTDPDQNSDSTEIKVTVLPVNDRPMFAALPSLNLSSALSKQINLANYSEDVDDETGNLSWTTMPTENVQVSINGAGVATFTVLEAWFGEEDVAIYVSDASNARDTSFVTVYRQNAANSPQISGLNDATFLEDESYQYELDDYVDDGDNDDDEINWSFSGYNNVIPNLDQNTRLLTLTPTANWYGEESIYLRASDPDGNVDFDTIKVVVTAVNDLPTISTIEGITILDNSFMTLDLKEYISEPDGYNDLEEIKLLSSNNGFIGYYMDRPNMELTFFSPSGYYGVETFLLRVKDKNGAEASAAFTVEVLEENIDGAIATAFLGSATTVTMSWQTRKATRDYVEFGLDNSYGRESDQDAAFLKQHTHILANLEENQTYHFRVVSETQDGKLSYSPDSTFTTGIGGDINVFPIPYRASEDVSEQGIFFSNLPVGAEVRIYNLLGEPVFKISDLDRLYRWPVVNDNDKKVSSGLYIYVVKDEKGKKVASGKVLVVR